MVGYPSTRILIFVHKGRGRMGVAGTISLSNEMVESISLPPSPTPSTTPSPSPSLSREIARLIDFIYLFIHLSIYLFI